MNTHLCHHPGGKIMLGSIVDFFKNLPAKQCSKCSQPIEEQHDCYGDKCNTCLGLTDL